MLNTRWREGVREREGAFSLCLLGVCWLNSLYTMELKIMNLQLCEGDPLNC